MDHHLVKDFEIVHRLLKHNPFAATLDQNRTFNLVIPQPRNDRAIVICDGFENRQAVSTVALIFQEPFKAMEVSRTNDPIRRGDIRQ